MDHVDFEPSKYGFRSIRPRTRHERYSMKDKVSLEQSRINQRVGWQARQHQKNAPPNSSMLVSCAPGAAGYLSNADRFHSDTAGEELALRQEAAEKRLAAGQYRKMQSLKRDEDRWCRAEEAQKKQEEKYNRLREDPRRSQKNKSNVAYDITTLQYHQDTDGEHQKYVDDMVRYRATMRTNALVKNGDSRAAYNIISGDDRAPLAVPSPVTRPGGLESAENIRAVVSSRVDTRRTPRGGY